MYGLTSNLWFECAGCNFVHWGISCPICNAYLWAFYEGRIEEWQLPFHLKAVPFRELTLAISLTADYLDAAVPGLTRGDYLATTALV
jgi:hypothetical protein